MIEFTDEFNKLDDNKKVWSRGYHEALHDTEIFLDCIVEWLHGEQGYAIFSYNYFNDIDKTLSDIDVQNIKSCLLCYLEDRRNFYLKLEGLK